MSNAGTLEIPDAEIILSVVAHSAQRIRRRSPRFRVAHHALLRLIVEENYRAVADFE